MRLLVKVFVAIGVVSPRVIFCHFIDKIGYIKNAENKLVYPYTLSKGANQSNVALDMAREANLFE